MRISGDHELPGLHGKQVVFPHDSDHALVIGQHASPPQLRRNSTVTVAASMFQHDLLDGRSQLHVFFNRSSLLQGTIKSRPAHLQGSMSVERMCQLAQAPFVASCLELCSQLPVRCHHLDQPSSPLAVCARRHTKARVMEFCTSVHNNTHTLFNCLDCRHEALGWPSVFLRDCICIGQHCVFGIPARGLVASK